MKLHQEPEFIDDMVNSTEVVVHSKTIFVNGVQNQLLFQRPLMLCVNWYCKIVMWHNLIVRLTQPWALVGPSYIQYCMNIWLWKKFVHVGSHTICQSLKKGLVSIGRKKCSKITIAVPRNTSITSWQMMNRGFTRMCPKVNSSRLYGCFNMSQIQQKLLAHDALPRKWSAVFSEKLDVSQLYH